MRRWEVIAGRDSYDGEYLVILRNSNQKHHETIADVWTNAEDARLLAAAPELLEELKWAIGMLEELVTESELKGARELIERLEG